MTFVRAKLLMERMKPGEVAEILLSGGDPLENVPRAIWEHGYEIISLEPENEDIYKLIIKKFLYTYSKFDSAEGIAAHPSDFRGQYPKPLY